jgi:hypothetical protein
MLMTAGRVDMVSWLIRLFAWDGMLPAGIVLAPFGIEFLFPNNRGIMEITAVTLPVMAFLLRIVAGLRRIDSNRCSVSVRRFQYCAFCFAILPLVLVDCAVILAHVMPAGAVFADAKEVVIWGAIYLSYLLLMTFAMYPGRSEPSPDDWDSFVPLAERELAGRE